MTLHALLQFLTEAATDPAGPQARQLADAAHNLYRFTQAVFGTFLLLRKLRRTASAVPARRVGPGSGSERDALSPGAPHGARADDGGVTVIVLEEPRPQTSEDSGPGDALPAIGKIHAAPTDPDVPGDHADRTFCGKNTAGMDTLSYRPSGPGSSWYPPNKRQWTCQDCDTALRTG